MLLPVAQAVASSTIERAVVIDVLTMVNYYILLGVVTRCIAPSAAAEHRHSVLIDCHSRVYAMPSHQSMMMQQPNRADIIKKICEPL